MSASHGARIDGELPTLVDLHNHFVPGVDDGARTVDDAISTLEELSAQGVRRVATTPHLSASRATGPRKLLIETKFKELQAAAEEAVAEVELSLAFEVRLNDPDADLSDRSLGLSRRHLLVEFSMLALPAYSVETLGVVARQDWVPVLAHPERYAGVEARYPLIEAWRRAGAVMCVNAASLWGAHGREAEAVSRRMLADGAVDLIASDNHARSGRSETVRQTWDLLTEEGHQDIARLLISSNPWAILEGRDPARVPPIRLNERWTRRLKRFIGRSR